jgi:hypothetical protein
MVALDRHGFDIEIVRKSKVEIPIHEALGEYFLSGPIS